jgi:hypothetical protein
MDTMVSQGNSLAANAGDMAREKIILSLRDLVYALEKPTDIMQLIMFYMDPERGIVFKQNKKRQRWADQQTEAPPSHRSTRWNRSGALRYLLQVLRL